MKNSILVLVAMAFLFAGYGQNTFKPGIGINFTDFSQDKNGNATALVGWQIGGSFMRGTKKLYFEPGIFYVEKSTEFESSDSAFSDFSSDISGIRVPIAVGLNVLGNVSSGIALRVFGGPSMFFITGTSGINKDLIDTFNWGLFAGAGVDFWKLFLDFSYEWSMSKIQKDNSQLDLGKMRTLYITAGFRIERAKK